jgi:hypothetical protein
MEGMQFHENCCQKEKAMSENTGASGLILGNEEPKFMPLPIFGGTKIFGGPYFHKPERMAGVKMAVEIDLPCDISVPTRDYSVPNEKDLRAGLVAAVDLLAAGRELYAGCYGGIGRTGLFMACMAKAARVPDPVAWVRQTYNPHAVETPEQQAFVKAFDVSAVFNRMVEKGAFKDGAKIEGATSRRWGLFGRR